MLSRFPQKFGSYVLLKPLGQGGMGVVSLAMSGHRELETLCVVKRMLPALLSEPDQVRRFRHEADLARRLVHSNLVHTHNIGEIDGEVFLVQEFVEGRDVSALLEEMTTQRRELPVGVAVYIASEIARGLAYAHAFERLDLVHRDINLPNVRLTYAGEVKLLDFGIASSNLHGEVLGEHGAAGKLWHLAPEQVRPGGKIDSRTDIYALGVVLWELLTERPIGTVIENGRERRQPETEGEVLAWITRGEHLPPSTFNRDVPPGLDELVGRAMSILPEHRPASADELRGKLAAFIPAGLDAEAHLAALMKALFSPEDERAERRHLIEAGRKVLDDEAARTATSTGPAPRDRRKKVARKNTTTTWITPIAVGAALGLALLFWLHRDSPDRGTEAEVIAPRATEAMPAPLPSSAAAIVAAPPAQPAVTDAKAPLPAQEKASHGENADATPATPARIDHLATARQAFNDRDWPRALSEGKKAVAAGGSAEAYALVGNTYFKMGRFVEAATEYAKAVELDPKNQLMQQRLRIAHARAQDNVRGEAP